ncbi:hypothetical protein FA15DRAFT_131274 [Coprinopsis marcescibilis]|uniref:Uncharacterized protein n=1 Tax=Coprinopsis marcescibilis TaxID=230819 RepID=A0A5C3L423_COPMA|nr:hypothetical protein FA15DRAFT_131274 [Coprinopsis marcescibilis]
MASTHPHNYQQPPNKFLTLQQDVRLPSLKELNFGWKHAGSTSSSSSLLEPQFQQPQQQQQPPPAHPVEVSRHWNQRQTPVVQQHTPPLSAGHDVVKRDSAGYAHPGMPLSVQIQHTDTPRSPAQQKRPRQSSSNTNSVSRDIRETTRTRSMARTRLKILHISKSRSLHRRRRRRHRPMKFLIILCLSPALCPIIINRHICSQDHQSSRIRQIHIRHRVHRLLHHLRDHGLSSNSSSSSSSSTLSSSTLLNLLSSLSNLNSSSSNHSINT